MSSGYPKNGINKGWFTSERSKGNQRRKGLVPWNKGVPHTEETKKKLSKSVKSYFQLHPEVVMVLSEKRSKTALEYGIGKWMKGKRLSEETKEKMSITHKRINPPRKFDKHRVRGQREWAKWRKDVYERDGYTCQECGTKGGYLEPHHIIPRRLNGELFNIKNGITLCRPCHLKTLGKELEFAELYSEKVQQHS